MKDIIIELDVNNGKKYLVKGIGAPTIALNNLCAGNDYFLNGIERGTNRSVAVGLWQVVTAVEIRLADMTDKERNLLYV